MADIKSSGECLKAVGILLDELKNAKRSLISSEGCIVNRNLMQAQLEYLQENLPDTVKKAATIVEKEEAIRTETEQKKHEILDNATQQAQNMVNEATQNAQQMMEQASREAPMKQNGCLKTLKTRQGSWLKKKISSDVPGLNATNSGKAPARKLPSCIKTRWIISIPCLRKQTGSSAS